MASNNVQYISSNRFTVTCGEVFIVPKRINQDNIESCFFLCRDRCVEEIVI